MFALLPMKAHSERVPRKNVRKLYNKPLFFHVADTLRDTEKFEALIINTDCEEIKSLAEDRYGSWVEVVSRDSALLGDKISMNLIIEQDLRECPNESHFFQTHSTSPLISAETISAAVNQYQINISNCSHDSLFSVTKHLSRFYDGNFVPLNHNVNELIRTQDLPPIYQENSCFYVFSRASFVATRSRIGKSPSMFVMEHNNLEQLDIDTESDWSLINFILRSKADG